MQLTPAALEAAFYNFQTLFKQGYGRRQPWSKALTTEVPSTTRENRYPWMGRIPRLREWIGERVVKNLASRAYAIANRDFELTIGVDRNDFEDDQLAQYSALFMQMGEQSAVWPDDLVKAILQAGDSTACWDGQNFFDTDHPVNIDDATLGVQANLFNGTALTRANFQAVRQAMRVYRDEDGKPLAINPRTLIVPPQLEDIAKEIVIADTVPNAAGTASQTNVNKGDATPMVLEELSDEPTTWYLADLSKPLKPFIFQLRKAPNLVRKDQETDENVFNHKQFLYGIDARGNAGYGLPLVIAKAKA